MTRKIALTVVAAALALVIGHGTSGAPEVTGGLGVTAGHAQPAAAPIHAGLIQTDPDWSGG